MNAYPPEPWSRSGSTCEESLNWREARRNRSGHEGGPRHRGPLGPDAAAHFREHAPDGGERPDRPRAPDSGERPDRPRARDCDPPERRGLERRREPASRDGDDSWPLRERRKGQTSRRRADSWRSRSREFVNRYKAPLIGLTLAGAAAPFSRSMEAPVERDDEESHERAAHAAAAGALDDRIATRWAEARADRLRDDTITGAQTRFGIERALAEDIFDIAVQEGIEPEIAFGLVNVESTFRQRAVSHVGARGLAQVMPRTARGLMPGITAEDLFDRRTNLTVGFRYLNKMVDKYNGNMRLALLAYNRGPGTVDRILAQGGDPNNGYADRVLAG